MSYASEVTTDSPRAWYRCQEASGYIQDSSGNAMHATATVGAGSATYHQTSPIISEPSDYAILLNTPFGFQIGDNTPLDVGDVWTTEAWVKRASADSGSTEYSVVEKGGGAYWMGFTADKLTMAKSGVAYIVQSTTTLTDTTGWHHIVATKNVATCKLYIDGVDVTGAVTNQTTVDTAINLFVGSEGAASYFTGAIDEVAIYATALSQARVQAHYNAAFGQTLLPDADVAAGGWTTTPLWSKVNDSSDATIITATAA